MRKKKAKKGTKRKKDDLSDQSDNSSGGSFMSSIISAASHVLYGTPAKPNGEDMNEVTPSTSTPKAATPSTSTPKAATPSTSDGVIMDILAEQNTKLSFIMEKLSKLDKIDMIEQKLNVMNSQLANFEGRIGEIENIAKTNKEGMEGVSEDVKNLEEKHKRELKRHEKMIEEVHRNVEKLRKERCEIDEKLTDLQYRSMKMNLIFTGLAGETRQEDTEGLLRCFLQQELGINQTLPFANVHRFGRFTRNTPRPIVARFLFRKDFDLVKANAFKLRGSEFRIREQYPVKMEERRRMLYPVMRAHREEGDRVKLVRDRLYINGQLFDFDDNFDREDPEMFYDADGYAPVGNGEFNEPPVDPPVNPSVDPNVSQSVDTRPMETQSDGQA